MFSQTGDDGARYDTFQRPGPNGLVSAVLITRNDELISVSFANFERVQEGGQWGYRATWGRFLARNETSDEVDLPLEGDLGFYPDPPERPDPTECPPGSYWDGQRCVDSPPGMASPTSEDCRREWEDVTDAYGNVLLATVAIYVSPAPALPVTGAHFAWRYFRLYVTSNRLAECRRRSST